MGQSAIQLTSAKVPVVLSSNFSFKSSLFRRIVSCRPSDFSPIKTSLYVVARPLPRRPAHSPYFHPVWTPHPGLQLDWGGYAFAQDYLKCGAIYSNGKGNICASFLAVSVLFCNNEHLQTDRRPLSFGCYHHPATQNMEKQVMCRWVLSSVLYLTCWSICYLTSNSVFSLKLLE